MRSTFLLLPFMAFAAPYARAADLIKIERSIRKEPAYLTKTPKYCLLVFGPEAKTRLWLVLDGKTLYVDRNGNGDLTDDGEKVAAAKGRATLGEDGEIFFAIGDIHDGPRTHKKLFLTIRKMDYLADRDADVKTWLAKTPGAWGYILHAEVDLPGWKGVGSGGRVDQFAGFRDVCGILTFADKPRDAPILHFGGPWHITLSRPSHLILGRENEVIVRVGSQGLGAGTFAEIAYEDVIPEQFHPRVEITFPPKRSGTTAEKQSFTLMGRC